MGKYIFASVVIVMLVIIAVLLVRYEMDKTREAVDKSIKEAASTAARAAANDALGGTPKAAQDAVEAVAEGLGKVAGKLRDGLKPSPAQPEKPVDKDKPVAGGSATETTPEGKPEKPEAKPNPMKPGPATTDKKPMPGDGLPIPIPSNPNDVIGSIFGAARDATKTADDLGQEFVGMSIAEERKIGRDVHGSIVKEKKVYDNPKQLSRVKRLAQPLLDKRTRKDIEYNFTLIDEPDVNAFSHLGGFVYLYRGLLDFCGDDDMLQYVLGHEIAHVDLKHCVRGMNYAAKADSVTGGVGGTPVILVYKLIAAGYSEDQEFASDEWAYKTMRKLGKSHEQTILFTRRFLDFLKAAGKPTGREKPTSIPGAVMQEIDDHFQSHPSAEERLARLEKMK